MEGKENITEKDLDFYLTVIALFCEYNPTEHYSDIMFKDITSDIIKRDYILYRLAEDGYISIKKIPTRDHHFKIDITTEGAYFQMNGGYKAQNEEMRKKKWLLKIEKYRSEAISGIIGAIISGIATYITTKLCE